MGKKECLGRWAGLIPVGFCSVSKGRVGGGSYPMGVYSARVGPSRGVSGYITTKSLSVGYNQFTVNSPQDLCQIIKVMQIFAVFE